MSENKDLTFALEIATKANSMSAILLEKLINSEDNNEIDCVPGTDLGFSYSLLSTLFEQVSKVILDNTP